MQTVSGTGVDDVTTASEMTSDRSKRCTVFLLHAWKPIVAHCEGGLEMSPGLVWLIYYGSWRTEQKSSTNYSKGSGCAKPHKLTVFMPSCSLKSLTGNMQRSMWTERMCNWVRLCMDWLCSIVWLPDSIAQCVQSSIYLNLEPVSEWLGVKGIKIDTKKNPTTCKGRLHFMLKK